MATLAPAATGLLQRACACGGHAGLDGTCSDCRRKRLVGEQRGLVQAKLKVSRPGDRYEQEAERIADQVMRMPSPAVQRRAPGEGEEEEEDEKLRTEPVSARITRLVQRETVSEDEALTPSGEAALHRLPLAGGRPLDPSTQAFFEPRFGHDFGDVRVHVGPEAAAAAERVGARGFTIGRDVVLGARESSRGSSDWLRLLAHELAHVVQQGGSSETVPSIQRAVGANSNCAANTHNAPADPIAELTSVDALAQDMASGGSGVLFVEALTFSDPVFGPSYVFNAYRDWFGTPQQTSSGAWRSRFRTATFATEEEATAHEMQVLSNRFERIQNWLAGDIRYRCPGTSSFTIPGCSAGPCGTDAAQTCAGGSRTIAICPPFWLEPAPRDRSQAALLIHEAIHPLFHFRAHSTATPAGRARNPGCYQGFLLSIYNTGLLPADCTPV